MVGWCSMGTFNDPCPLSKQIPPVPTSSRFARRFTAAATAAAVTIRRRFLGGAAFCCAAASASWRRDTEDISCAFIMTNIHNIYIYMYIYICIYICIHIYICARYNMYTYIVIRMSRYIEYGNFKHSLKWTDVWKFHLLQDDYIYIYTVCRCVSVYVYIYSTHT